MTIVPVIRRLIITAVPLLVMPVLAYALSIYDVIQLSQKDYSDQDIMALIQATDSAFELKAKDIVRLKKLGLSESVIQAMLKGTPEETGARPASGSSAPSHAAATTHNHNEPAPVNSAQASAVTSFETPEKTVAAGRFDYESFQETGSGRHHHSAVNMAGVRLLVLRDEGSFPSVVARANAVVKRLKRAELAGEGTFLPGSATTDNQVMFYGRNADRPVIILKVSHSDARAYQRRSGRTVTPALLAAYWSDLLSDYWSIVINRVAPDRLSDLHEGEVLKALYKQWKKSSEMESAQLVDAARLLPRRQQQHLLRLAITVPHDFLISGSHLAEQP